MLEILSHDSAEISDEVRNLREGVLYGFFFLAVSAFPVSASHVFSVEALSASIDPPTIQMLTMPYPQTSSGRILATGADVAVRYNKLVIHRKTLLAKDIPVWGLSF